MELASKRTNKSQISSNALMFERQGFYPALKKRAVKTHRKVLPAVLAGSESGSWEISHPPGLLILIMKRRY